MGDESTKPPKEAPTERQVGSILNFFGNTMAWTAAVVGAAIGLYNCNAKPSLETKIQIQEDFSVPGKKMADHRILYTTKNTGGSSAKKISFEFNAYVKFSIYVIGSHMKRTIKKAICSAKKSCRYDIKELRKGGSVKILLVASDRIPFKEPKVLSANSDNVFIRDRFGRGFSFLELLVALFVLGLLVWAGLKAHSISSLILLESNRNAYNSYLNEARSRNLVLRNPRVAGQALPDEPLTTNGKERAETVER